MKNFFENFSLKKKLVQVVALVLYALISIFVFSKLTSSPDFYKGTLAELEEKQGTVMELSAASAAASAAITLIPGDVATPIADKLADLSSHFLVVLSTIFLEKYLLTITGMVTFTFLIPIACGMLILNLLFGWESLRLLAIRLAAFGLVIVLVIPASIRISNIIEETYHASIEQTLETAKETTADFEVEVEQQPEQEEQGFWSGVVSKVTNSVSNTVSGVADKAGEMVNRFMEALAVMLVTSCVIPVLVLLSFAWFARTILSVDLSISYGKLYQGMKTVTPYRATEHL